MTKEKSAYIARLILTGLLAFVLCVPAYAAGLLTADGGRFWKIAAVICYCLIGSFAIVNISVYAFFSKRSRIKELSEIFGTVDKLKARIGADPEKAKRRLKREVALAYIFTAVLIALVIFTCYVYGRTAPVNTVIVMLLFVYITFCALEIFTTRPKADFSSKFVLDEKAFPLLYATVRDAARAVGCVKPLVVSCDGNAELSVTEFDGRIYIGIGYLNAAYMTREELHSALIHEFAHVTGGDTRMSERVTRMLCRFDKIDGAVILAHIFFFSGITTMIKMGFEYYALFASEHLERTADSAVKEHCDPATYVNALAKSEILDRYANIAVPELDFYYYESEECAGNFSRREVELYPEYIERYGKQWLSYLTSALPKRVDTHPVFSERMRAMGRSEFDAFAVEPDADYVAECRKVAAAVDEAADDSYYAFVREQRYLLRKADMEQYDRAAESGALPTYGQLSAALYAYYGVDDDKAVEIADKMIERGVSTAEANYIKGRVMLRRGERECIEFFRVAAKDYRFAEDALNGIGEFANVTGDKALLEEYRAGLPDAVRDLSQKFERIGFTADKPVSACDLDEATLKPFTVKLADAGINAVKRIYMCKYVDEDGIEHYPFTVVFYKLKMLGRNKLFDYFYRAINIIDMQRRSPADPDYIYFAMDGKIIRKIKKYGTIVYSA